MINGTMYILAIETTGAYASVALLQTGTAQDEASAAADAGSVRILEVIHGNDRFSHLQNLTPQIDQVLRNNELAIGDMTAIAVSQGPGSFTGIRIGVATARALSQVTGLPCLPVSSLEALALRALERETGTCDGTGRADASGAYESAGATPGRTLVCPILDARRRQVYGAAYELMDGRPVCRISPASCLLTEFLERLDQYCEDRGRGSLPIRQILFLGDGIDTCGDLIRAWETEKAGQDDLPRIICVPPETRYQDAGTVALRGLQLYQAGETCHYMELEPVYLRMAEAEKKLRDRQAARRQSDQDQPAFAGENRS